MRLNGIVLGMICIARIARGDAPSIAGHVALGVRTTSTSDAQYGVVWDDTGSVRAAAEGLIGLRIGPAVVGLHAGIATPMSFSASPIYDSAEQVASTDSTIYPFDLGLGAQVDVSGRFWISAWLGATVSLSRASSPAAHINAIDFTGDIPAASWSDRTTSLGYGAALGYDVDVTQQGRWAVLLTLDFQGIADIPFRNNNGYTTSVNENLTSRSLTLNMAYRY